MTDSAVAEVLESEEDIVRDTRVEQLLTEWNLPYELDQAFPLSRLKIENAAQIRAEVHRAPKTTVDQYVTHMRHGAIFPPIVVASNAMLVDGNTRIAACAELNRKTFPAYKVKFPHLGMAKMIAAALNQMGGDRLTEDEIVVAAEAMIAERYADEAIARTLGRSVSHIRNVRQDRKFRELAERTGLTELRLPKQVGRILASIQHDEPFKAAAQAIHRAKPSAKDVSELAKRIDQTRSDAEALAEIRQTEANWGPVTGPPPQRRSVTRSLAKKALVHVRALLAATEDPADLVLPDNAEAQQAWQSLNTLTTNVLAMFSTRLQFTGHEEKSES